MAKITMEDVARAAGVSKATVSYVLNGRTTKLSLSEQTVSRVLAVCRELDYRPDATAAALSSLRQAGYEVLVLSPWLYVSHSDFMSQVYRTLDELRDSCGLRATFAPYESGNLPGTLKPSRVRRCDAVLLVGTQLSEDVWLEKHAADFDGKLLVLNRELDAPGLYAVCGNDYEAMRELCRRAEGNYDRFVLLREGEGSLCRAERIRAVREHFGAALTELPCPTSPQEELALYRQFAADHPCFLYTMYPSAARMCVTLHRAGVRLPDDCGVVGYDMHSLIAQYLPMAVTTMDPRVCDMVRTACEGMRGLREGKPPVGITRIRAELLPGESARLSL